MAGPLVPQGPGFLLWGLLVQAARVGPAEEEEVIRAKQAGGPDQNGWRW
jgi:hypothetical protein